MICPGLANRCSCSHLAQIEIVVGVGRQRVAARRTSTRVNKKRIFSHHGHLPATGSLITTNDRTHGVHLGLRSPVRRYQGYFKARANTFKMQNNTMLLLPEDTAGCLNRRLSHHIWDFLFWTTRAALGHRIWTMAQNNMFE